ncbi:hypothetical protein CWI38_1135p0020 [Hamiltosporidium tvaerminnensis]|uniref:Uncharacterized protein n=1 Tax=Hamiltosporidium tvaerminnensis TaxID=1176355 RepID=A0A4Q9LTS8_9MICR|nr:hypothetical protein CWI38_1135p0020 [Hamiltosporidium tvaerminnensis]
MLLKLLDCLEKSKEISTRRAAILKVEKDNKTHLALIKGFLKVKYRLVEEVTKKSLEEAQLAKLYNEIEKRKLHSKLYNARKNELVSRGHIRPRNEAVFCYIQDRNVFWGADGVCQHWGKSGKTVDHLATRCEKMLVRDYTRRHNEVSSKRILSHLVQEILDNKYAEVRVDTRIKNEYNIRCNRPDIFILDKRQSRITLNEVLITSQDTHQIVEREKLRKYDLFANELGLIYKYSTYFNRLQIPMDGEAYIQSISLKNTVEMISFDRRRRLDVMLGVEMHKKPTYSLKQEPIFDTNEELELEQEIERVKMVERII